MSSIGWLLREYAETRNGRIVWGNDIAMFPGTEGRRKRLQRNTHQGRVDWEDLTNERGEVYSFFRGRSGRCKNVALWEGKFPIMENRGRPYTDVPAKDCKECEFHEPAKRYGRNRYSKCRWFRENSGMDHPLQLLANAVNKAKEIIG